MRDILQEAFEKVNNPAREKKIPYMHFKKEIRLIETFLKPSLRQCLGKCWKIDLNLCRFLLLILSAICHTASYNFELTLRF